MLSAASVISALSLSFSLPEVTNYGPEVRIPALLDVINDADDPIRMRRSPVNDGVDADSDAVARQNLCRRKSQFKS